MEFLTGSVFGFAVALVMFHQLIGHYIAELMMARTDSIEYRKELKEFLNQNNTIVTKFNTMIQGLVNAGFLNIEETKTDDN